MLVVVCEEVGRFGENIVAKLPFADPDKAMDYVGKTHEVLGLPWKLVAFGGYNDGLNIFLAESHETYENTFNGGIREFKWYITDI